MFIENAFAHFCSRFSILKKKTKIGGDIIGDWVPFGIYLPISYFSFVPFLSLVSSLPGIVSFSSSSTTFFGVTTTDLAAFLSLDFLDLVTEHKK